jgi:integrase
MPPMGRRRKDTASDLEPRVYLRSGAYYYVHRITGKWEHLGTSKAAANERARLHNDPAGLHGTMVHWLDLFLVHCEARVKAGSMAARTLADYTEAIKGLPERPAKGQQPARPAVPGPLRVYFAPPMTPLDVTPAMVNEYLQIGAELGRPVPANREKAALSSCMGWLCRNSKVPGLVVNPCLRASGIQRNRETARDRYVTHDEYRDVWAEAHTSTRLLMEITYRTLQRPESDVIHWDTTVLAVVEGRRVIKFKQGKTGKTMQIEVSPDLNTLIKASLGDVPKLRQPLIRTADGNPYSYDGISSNLKKAIARANKKRAARGAPPMASFGFRDLKGKGATDMWRDGVPIEQIQQLCGHEDKTTTEIYVKARWNETVTANKVAM